MEKNKVTTIFTVVLFHICSLSIVIGIAISAFFIFSYPLNNLGQILPIIIGSGISMLLMSIYLYFITKEYRLVRMHMKKNWLTFDWIAIFINIFNILFALIFITITANIGFWTYSGNSLYVILLIGITYGVSLVAVGFHEYFMHKVKFDLRIRREGE
ncbi:MAG: hypothetical protein ACRCVI_00365 [Mycoplasmoidaceae bacterium]